MTRVGRPQTITNEAIIAAGMKVTLPELSIKKVAEEMQVSHMSIYRHVGTAQRLYEMVGEALVNRLDLPMPNSAKDPECFLYELCVQLREQVHLYPGLAKYLLNMDLSTKSMVQRVEEYRDKCATAYGWSKKKTSVLVSSLTLYAICLERQNNDLSIPDISEDVVGKSTYILAGCQFYQEKGITPFAWLTQLLVRSLLAETEKI